MNADILRSEVAVKGSGMKRTGEGGEILGEVAVPGA
jgi:hypothetical protein